ncbi:MAG: YceI family protein [Bacteroidetes bacterium]|nr:YceI family protein [Bacteroidota bacterium]MBS1648454.1 YceI family protein [Bacteroidota bacterium]
MKKKIIISLLIIIVLSIIGVWYFVFYNPVHNRRSVENEKGITINAADLVKEFVTNEDSANKKYVNKTIQISGIVSNTVTDSISTTIFIATNDSVNTISVRLIKNNTTIIKGSTVTVKGILTGFILNEVQLNEAVIISSTPPSTVITKKEMPDTATVSADSSIKKKQPIVTTKKEIIDTVKIYKSKTAAIKFFSHTPAEDIEAINTQIVSSFNTNTGEINFAALIKGFRFENEMMQDHFNKEKYLNSTQFPKALFKGNITNLSSIKFNTNGTYNTSVTGSLTIKGVTKNITTNGTITINSNNITIKSVFNIHVQDYDVDGSDVADTIEITVNASYS